MFWKKLGLIFLFLFGVLLVVILWLRLYTHHGQTLNLPDYVGENISDAMKKARKKSFQMVVIDSLFLVGKEGGLIVDQNPKGGSQVKKRRKIYVTTTKNAADQIPLGRLPVLYGKSFGRKQKELKQGFEINSKVVGRKFDPGAPDHILEVIYQGQTVISSKIKLDDLLIDKGGTLEMILSQSTGGSLVMPDFRCMSYEEALFQLQTLQLVLGEITREGAVNDLESAFVTGHYPASNSPVFTGDSVDLYVSQNKPDDCQ